MKFLSFLSPYTLWIKIGLIVAALVYVSYLNIRINYLKSANAKLEASVLLWQASNELLIDAAEIQNEELIVVRKANETAQQAAQKSLKIAQQASSIRQGKITAASARIKLEKPTSCENAIAEVKKELQ